MTCNVAFIGLGVMGYPMAGYISKAGHNVTVFNRTKSKAEKWLGEYKGKIAETPAEAAKDAEYIFTCVGNDNDLRDHGWRDHGLEDNELTQKYSYSNKGRSINTNLSCKLCTHHTYIHLSLIHI